MRSALQQRPRFVQDSTLNVVQETPGISLMGDSERFAFPDVLRLQMRRQTVTREAPDTIKWPPSEVSVVPILNYVELLIKLLHVTVKAGLQFECLSSRVRGFPRHIQSCTRSNAAQTHHSTVFLFTSP